MGEKMLVSPHGLQKRLLLSTTILATFALQGAQAQEQETVESLEPVEEVVVTGTFIPDEKRATSEISNVLDAEDFTRTGDSLAVDALKRVTGLSVVDGKFIFVRGLGTRYSNTLFDGSNFPSPEPLTRTVPLDLFPVSVLDGTLVQKTWSPQFPAQFGGGLVELRSKGIPDERFFTVSIGTGFNSVSTFEDGLLTANGDLNVLGIDGSFRSPGALPDPLDDGFEFAQLPSAGTSSIFTIVNGVQTDLVVDGLTVDPSQTALFAFDSLTPAEQEAAAEDLPATFTPDSEPLAPDFDLTLTYGDRFEFGNGSALGILALIDYGSQQRSENGQRNRFGSNNSIITESSVEACVDANFSPDQAQFCGVNQTQWEIALNGYLSLGYEINQDHSLSYSTLLLRQTTQNAVQEGGVFSEFAGVETRIDWIERQVWYQQVKGDHYLNFFEKLPFAAAPLEAHWRFAYAEIDREVPNRRVTTYAQAPSGFVLRREVNLDNFTQFLDLSQEDIQGGVDFVAPINLFKRPVDLKFGFDRLDQDRRTGGTRFFLNSNQTSGVDFSLFPELIFTPDNIAQDVFGAISFQPLFDFSDYTQVEFENLAAYFVADAQIFDTLRISAGFRWESSEQTSSGLVGADDISFLILLDGFEGITNGDFFSSTIDENFLLPAASLTWEFTDNWQLRLAYSETLTRPDLREFSAAQFIDPATNDLIQGNPALVNTRLTNYDARFEYYFGEADSLSFAGFYKQIDDPIERAFFIFGNNPTFGFLNGGSGEIVGAEVELEIDVPLRNWINVDFLANKDFYFIGNFTYSQSNVDVSASNLSGQLTNQVRRLQGQSDYLANVQFGYRDYESGELLTILLNFTSNRITDVGALGAQDVFEEVPILLDFNFQKEFDVASVPLTFKLRATNLLNDDRFFRQGDEEFVFGQFELGRSFSLSLTAEF